METKSKKLPPGQIFLFNNAIPDDLCNEMISLIDRKIKNGTTTEEVYKKNSNVRSDNFMLPEILHENKELYEKLDSKIYKCVNNICVKLCNEYKTKIQINGDSGYQIRRIKGPTREHTDGIVLSEFVTADNMMAIKNVRTMSLIFALNGDYEGGEFCFPEQNIMIKLKKGQAIAFPPFWTHPHYTKELKDNTFRYTINTWLNN